jgi:hypothetical protein
MGRFSDLNFPILNLFEIWCFEIGALNLEYRAFSPGVHACDFSAK